jgi:hypothetical protein
MAAAVAGNSGAISVRDVLRVREGGSPAFDGKNPYSPPFLIKYPSIFPTTPPKKPLTFSVTPVTLGVRYLNLEKRERRDGTGFAGSVNRETEGYGLRQHLDWATLHTSEHPHPFGLSTILFMLARTALSLRPSVARLFFTNHRDRQ